MIEEADEACYGKQSALTNLALIVQQGETMGVIDMYERAAWRNGASVAETEFTIRTARAERRASCDS